MAYSSYVTASRGYDLSLFETSGTAAKATAPKKVKKKQYNRNNVVELPDMAEYGNQRRKHNVVGLVFGFALASVIALVVGIIIHGQVQLAELNQQITTAHADLETSRSEYVQLQASVDASVSTAAVEAYARDELGMIKATNQQKEYISLSGGDKGEIFAEGEGKIFD